MSDEMDLVRKELKKAFKSAGIKDASIRKGRGTAWDWTDIDKGTKKTGYRDWEDREVKVLEGDFGFRVGNKANSITARSHEIKVALYGYKAKRLKNSPAYKKLKEEYYRVASQTNDMGTSVGGAGTIVKHQGKPIDFWRERGQSETGSWKAEETLKDKIKKMGLEFQHEGGWMD